MWIIKNRKIFYIISSVMVLASIFSIFYYGLRLGIDFKGGSIVEVEYADPTADSNQNLPERPSIEEVTAKLVPLGLGEMIIRATGEAGYIIRTKDLKNEERIGVTNLLSPAKIKRFDTVGPVLGQELQGKALWSIFLVILAIVLFITFTFRKVSKPVSSWKYGLVAIIALIHDVIIPTGFFAILGHFNGVEVDSLFVTALLVILGFSIHDTIVVFDRTRENLKHNPEGKHHQSFEDIVGKSVSSTFTRSINTSLTVLLSLVVLYYFGPETTKNFSLALLVGLTAGTYSSIFIGSPLLVTLEKMQEKK